MLKITINIKSNILFKNSNARLLKVYEKLFYYNLIFFKNLQLQKKKNTKVFFKINRRLKHSTTTLIRSPFHYKVSKTILAQPIQTLQIIILTTCDNDIKITDFFLQKNWFKRINKNNVFVIKNIKVETSHV